MRYPGKICFLLYRRSQRSSHLVALPLGQQFRFWQVPRRSGTTEGLLFEITRSTHRFSRQSRCARKGSRGLRRYLEEESSEMMETKRYERVSNAYITRLRRWTIQLRAWGRSCQISSQESLQPSKAPKPIRARLWNQGYLWLCLCTWPWNKDTCTLSREWSR